MPSWIIDIAIIIMLGVVAWAVSSEGLWGSALLFVNLMFSGLIAFSYFEMLAPLLSGVGVAFITSYADCFFLWLLFGVTFTLIRLATDFLGGTLVKFPGLLEQIGKVCFGIITAWYFCGMALAAVQTAPIHKQFIGYQWENHALFGMGIDRYWLGYVHDTTNRIFEHGSPTPFDKNCDFIRRYHDFRPFGAPDPALQ